MLTPKQRVFADRLKKIATAKKMAQVEKTSNTSVSLYITQEEGAGEIPLPAGILKTVQVLANSSIEDQKRLAAGFSIEFTISDEVENTVRTYKVLKGRTPIPFDKRVVKAVMFVDIDADLTNATLIFNMVTV
jgi:hypothetical protein